MLAPKVVTLAIVLASCTGERAAPRAPEPPSWDAMSTAQRHAHMTSTVMPEMKSLFSAFDRGRYARMTCATCHGKDGEARRFRMPNPDLLLEPEARQGAGAVNDFMTTKVAPEMARLLGRGSFDCFGCHAPDR